MMLSVVLMLYYKVTTWRIIPVTKWLLTMDSKSPRVVGPLPNGFSMAYKWGAHPNHLQVLG